MSVEIEPFELSFRRPFTKEVDQILKIKNPNKAPVAFKVKTTAPKQYCVRPNSGRIEPGKDVEVTVLLQAMKQEPPMDARCKDKFLVQSTMIQSDMDATGGIPAVFEQAEKSSIQEKKIRVVWLSATSDGIQGPSAVTPKRESLANGHEATPDVSRSWDSPIVDPPASASGPPPYEAEVKTEAVEATQAPVIAFEKELASSTYEELKAKCLELQRELESLKSKGELRFRGKSDGGEKATLKSAEQTTAVRQAPEGVPVNLVAALCLISFLLAYFFF